MFTHSEEVRLRNLMSALWANLPLVAGVKGAQVIPAQWGNRHIRVHRGRLLFTGGGPGDLYVMPAGATEPEQGIRIKPFDEGPWWNLARRELDAMEAELKVAIEQRDLDERRRADQSRAGRMDELARAAALCSGEAVAS